MDFLQDLKRAKANGRAVEEAVKALWDGEDRTLILSHTYHEITGRIWEIYRSIETPSLRIRIVDKQGRVHHFNTLDIEVVVPVADDE